MSYILCLRIDENGHGVTPLELPGASLPFNLHITDETHIELWMSSGEAFRCEIASEIAGNVLNLRRLGFSLRSQTIVEMYNMSFSDLCRIIHFLSIR